MADALAKLLEELDLSKYAATFATNEVDLASAKLLSEQELGELGLALGARKKLYAALHAAPSAVTVPTTTPPAAATASQPASPINKITNISAWDWLFDSDKWSDTAGCYTGRFQFASGDEPKHLLWAGRARSGTAPVMIFDMERGARIGELTPSKGERDYWSDADWEGDTIVAVGGDRDANVAVFSASTQTEKGILCGMNERGLSDVSVMRSSSGALQAAAVDGGQNCGTLRVYDIETLARAGKHVGIFDSPPSTMQRDPNNPGCFLLSSYYKFWYIDGRVGKAVKRFGEGASTIHLPSNPGGVFIASDKHQNNKTQVWDLGTMKVLHDLQTKSGANFVSACMYANVAVTFGPMFSPDGGSWGLSFFDLAGATKSCPHELSARVYPNQQLKMTSRWIVGLDDRGSFVSLYRKGGAPN